MPRKTFVNGEILTDSDLNDYLMNQSVMTFASSTARGSAIPTPEEGMVTYLADSNSLDVWTGSSWVLVNNNDASIPKSVVTTVGDLIVADANASVTRLGKGTTGQVLTAGTATLEWDSAYPAVTTAGDLLVGTGAGAVTRLGKGTDGQVLTVVAGELAYATASADSMTLISSTSLSGVSTTLSSIPSTYKNLKLVILDYAVSAATRMRLRFNSDTGSSYHNWTWATAVDTIDSASTHFFEMPRDAVTGSTNNQFNFEILEYASSADIKQASGYGIFENSGIRNMNVVGGYASASAINSITIYTDDGTTTHSGTALLYGVK